MLENRVVLPINSFGWLRSKVNKKGIHIINLRGCLVFKNIYLNCKKLPKL